MSSRPVYVTQPQMPPLDEFVPYLQQIWRNKILTNSGPMHEQLEAALCDYLGVKYISLFNNGTIALLVALKALNLSGEVITTPYSFVATTHALTWNNLTPVFVDIDPQTFNLDPSNIEAAITEKTTAIMPVHCYGNPCDIERIQRIAHKHNLKVIYDAAHAFGVKDTYGSLLVHGDLSVLSFHATKVFNTFEGGAIVCHDQQTKLIIDRLKNFGICDEQTVTEAGLNGKLSEVHAAFGLLQLKHLYGAIQRRKSIDQIYRDGLGAVQGISFLPKLLDVVHNYSYFPILVKSDYRLSRDNLYIKLKENNIHARRYFYPLISDFPMYRMLDSANPDNLPVATSVSKQILCLPIYPDLSDNDVQRIVDQISQVG